MKYRSRNLRSFPVRLFMFGLATGFALAGTQDTERGREQRGALCEERPAGRSTGVGNTQLYNICIPPLPAALVPAGDQICEQVFGALFRAIAELEALANCVRLHRVECLQRDCPNPCLNSVTATSAGTGFYDALGFYCQHNAAAQQRGWTAACRMGNAVYACDCRCPQEIEQQIPEVAP